MRKTVSGVMLTLLVISMLMLAFDFQSVKSDGRVYVRADGSIDPFDAQARSVSRVFPLNVVFVGFEEELVDTALIDLNIQKSFGFNYGNYTINYSFNMDYYFANSSYSKVFKAFVLENSVNGTGTTSTLNATALEIQKTTGERTSIFLPQSGRAINATAVEEWFVANPYVPCLDSSYWFYVMNLTELDYPDRSLKHWYNATELDFEANRSRDFWRLEWDNALNPHVKFPYACFTSNSRAFIVDPSAHQWYLTWARIWWGLSANGPKYAYYHESLGEFLAARNVETIEGRIDLAYYLAGWIDDALANMLAPGLYTGIDMARAESVSIQVLVLNNASDFGYTNEVMSWIINSSLVEEAIIDLAPFVNVKVAVSFQDISSFPQIETMFEASVIEKKNGWTYYDGFQIWDGLYSVRKLYFDFTAADVVINSYILLEKNMSMMVFGGEYTGIGGEGQVLVMKEVGRYFQEDGISPKSGLGTTLIHEAGHNLGFPHTFVQGIAHAGDFAFDVMGYYPCSYFFTLFRKDCFRRLIVDFRLLTLQEKLDKDWALYERKTLSAKVDAKFDEVYSKIDEALQLYDELQFLEAHKKNVEAEKLETNLEDLIWTYLCDLKNDGVINIIDIAIAAAAFGSEPADPNWNPIADLNNDEIVNILDIAILAGEHGKTV